jgi:predicted Fe-Mo cluster-binding NifX family protein
MRIMVTAQGKEVTAPVDPRFGRCRFFILWDSLTQQSTAFANENASSSGAGISSAQFVIDHNVQVVISGEVGPRAAQVLQSAGVKIHTTTAATVQQALQMFQKGGNV